MTEIQERDIFKGRNTPYIGLGLFSGITGGLAMVLESSFLLWTAGIFLGLGAIGYLVGKYKSIRLLSEGIQLKRGQLGFKRQIPFELIESIVIKREREDIGEELMTFDLDRIDDWKNYKYLTISYKNKTHQIPQNEFETKEFAAFARNLQRVYLDAKGSPLQKADKVYQKTLNYISDDRRLHSELQLSLQEAYRSVFKPFETLYKKETISELDNDAEVLFHSIKQGNVLVYFKKGEYLPNIKETSIISAESLIEAAKNNLEIVETRLASHYKVKEKLERLKNQLKSRERLKNVANKLDELQQKNINKSLTRTDVEMEAEVLEQIELLTENIHNTETLEKSLVLKEHIALFKENVHEEEIMLKALNKKLE